MTLGAGVEQLYVFAVFWALGVGFFVVYLFATGLTRTPLSAFIFDGLFGALLLWCVWRVNLRVNNGEFRLFVFVGLALGGATTFFTCKTTLDKLSSLLYTWFTTSTVAKNENISKKINIDNICGGSDDTGAVSLHAFGIADADDVAETTPSEVDNAHRTGKTGRSKTTRTKRVFAIGRVRQGLGRKKRSHRERRRYLDTQIK